MSRVWKTFTENAVLGGLIVLIVGLTVTAKETVPQTISTGFTQREVAIREAKARGQANYSFSTGFIPGVGVIANPEAYRSEWEKEAQERAAQQGDSP